jgi:hypothetical protein
VNIDKSYQYYDALPRWRPGRYTEADAERCFAGFNREAMLIRIRNNKIQYEEHQGFQDRHECVLELLDRTRSVHTLPDTAFCLFTGDVRKRHEPQDECIFTFARHRWQRNPLFPNFNFIHHKACGIGDFYSEVLPELQAAARANPWEKRIDKVFFIGAPNGSLRKKLYEKTKNNPKYDIRLVDWNDPNFEPVSLADHCKYKYLINVNGWGYSGRLHYLLATGAKILLYNDWRPWRQYREFWYNKNFIHIKKNDFSEISEYINVTIKQI